jgi:hypothetical protein
MPAPEHRCGRPCLDPLDPLTPATTKQEPSRRRQIAPTDFSFVLSKERSSSQVEVAQLATMRKPGPSARDFRFYVIAS